MSINLPTITLSNRLALQSRPASQCSALYNLLCVASLTLKSKPARPGQVQPLYTTPKQDLRTAASVTTSPQKIPSSLLMQSRPARPEQARLGEQSRPARPVKSQFFTCLRTVTLVTKLSLHDLHAGWCCVAGQQGSADTILGHYLCPKPPCRLVLSLRDLQAGQQGHDLHAKPPSRLVLRSRPARQCRHNFGSFSLYVTSVQAGTAEQARKASADLAAAEDRLKALTQELEG
eukprot:1161558-Pelagomonas_calceolata.AAC.8